MPYLLAISVCLNIVFLLVIFVLSMGVRASRRDHSWEKLKKADRALYEMIEKRLVDMLNESTIDASLEERNDKSEEHDWYSEVSCLDGPFHDFPGTEIGAEVVILDGGLSNARHRIVAVKINERREAVVVIDRHGNIFSFRLGELNNAMAKAQEILNTYEGYPIY